MGWLDSPGAAFVNRPSIFLFQSKPPPGTGNTDFKALIDPGQIPAENCPVVYCNEPDALLEWATAARKAGVNWILLRHVHGAFQLGPRFSDRQIGCLHCLTKRMHDLDPACVQPLEGRGSPEIAWNHVMEALQRRSVRPRVLEIFDADGSAGTPNYLAPWPDCAVCGSGAAKTTRPMTQGPLAVAAADGGWRVADAHATLRAIERHVGAVCGQVGWLRAAPLPSEVGGWMAVAPHPRGGGVRGLARGYGATPEQAMAAALGRVFVPLAGPFDPMETASAGVWLEEAALHALCTLAAARIASGWPDPSVDWKDATHGISRPAGLCVVRSGQHVEVHPDLAVAETRLQRRIWDLKNGAAFSKNGDARWCDIHGTSGIRPVPTLLEDGRIDEALEVMQAWFGAAGLAFTIRDASRPDVPLAVAAVRLKMM